jgi:uncharacterized protein (TIGR02147 family)
MVSVFDHFDYRAFLREWYREAKAANRSVSYRWIAQRLGYASPGFFTQILQGKANLSLNIADGFADLAGLKGRAREYFLTLVVWNQAKDDASRQRAQAKLKKFREFRIHELGKEQERFMESWRHAAIREVLGIKPFQGDYAALAKSLMPPVTPDEARDSVELLLTLGLVARTAGGIVRREASLSAGRGFRQETSGRFFRQLHALGARALESFPVEERNLSWVTLSISDKAREEILAELRAFRTRALEIAARDPYPTRVHQLTLMLHPLSQQLLPESLT